MSIRALLTILLASLAFCQAPSPRTEAHDLLSGAMKDNNPDTRKEAVIAISLIGPREPYLSDLISMLEDKDVQVRLATIASLVDLKSRRTIEALHKALKDEVPEVSFSAARALYGLNDPAGKEELLLVLGGQVKTSSGFLTKQKREAMRMMHTPRTMFMFALVHGAAFAPVPGLGAGVASMQELLSDPGVSGRATTALLLGRENDEQTLQALKDALLDKDWSVRAAAVHSLALRNDSALQEDFVPLLEDDKQAVRLRAAAAYLRLDIVKARPRPGLKRRTLPSK
ncbi:MAG: HEAT repeat domain-containing protein [Bryobacteraceae bacterium]